MNRDEGKKEQSKELDQLVREKCKNTTEKHARKTKGRQDQSDELVKKKVKSGDKLNSKKQREIG